MKRAAKVLTSRASAPKLRVCFQSKTGPGERYRELTGQSMLIELPDAGSAQATRDRCARAIERALEEEGKKK